MRLDSYLVKIGLFDTRTKAKQAILREEVYCNGKVVNKVAFDVNEEKGNLFEHICAETYLSLGGYKLAKALKEFDFNVRGVIAADVGASTGGFTDCLLKNGASKVYAVDLNDQLLHKILKSDDRVISIIKNAKFLNNADFADKLDLIVADLSFISATAVLNVLSNLIDDGKHLIVLIKPQFENDEKIRFKNGIIRDKKIKETACKKIFDCAVLNNFIPEKITTAPIREDKNEEFLILLKRGNALNADFKQFIIKNNIHF